MFLDESGAAPSELIKMAVGAARVGEYGRARQHLALAHRKAPHDIKVLFWQGVVAPETSQAIIFLQRAARLAPRHPIVRRELWQRRLGQLPIYPDQPASPSSVDRLAREWDRLERSGYAPKFLTPLISSGLAVVLILGLLWVSLGQRSQGPEPVLSGAAAGGLDSSPATDLPTLSTTEPVLPQISPELESERAGRWVYTVQPGDSLEAIGARYGVSVEAIMAANDLRDHWIYPGQELIIPGSEGPAR